MLIRFLMNYLFSNDILVHFWKISFSDMNFFGILLFKDWQEIVKKLKYTLKDNLIANHSSPILFQASHFAYLLQ